LTVDPFLRYKKEIYALGDSVKGYPPTAQNAKQQGIWLAQYFNQTTTAPYEYHERGRLLDLTYAIFIEYKGIVWHIPYFLTPLVRALKE
jgi:NADH dehydrogenase FAD-containing subunit